jgi:hypothetical protein
MNADCLDHDLSLALVNVRDTGRHAERERG